VQECLPETDLEHVIVTGVGDLLSFPRSALVNFVLRYVRKQVRRYTLP
jgi:long-chain acyl-CoA synthetase